MSSLTEAELNSILGNTTSYQIYKKFDAENNLDENFIHCTEFISSNNTKNEKDEITCKKIAKNLKGLSELASTVKYRDKCLHYKYWIYDQIWKEFNIEGNNVGPVINKFLYIQTSVTKSLKLYSCLYNFYGRDLTELKNSTKKNIYMNILNTTIL
ncbi:hypothetical protein PCYB_003430 [Plasmodium cynomolgi strain B]|uniref:CYIR protein n=1 Tax=Plasmodium cynomolgi (strain B) TaxID=1120755 RepID=K6V009_PLACD|nr:hypothetical protein PCYB_003430 [Plasmodium cynomolgi strain B]GAB69594.1 hypothetical protein PCYB_003430 [Plasmodium cynomolgi strain B]